MLAAQRVVVHEWRCALKSRFSSPEHALEEARIKAFALQFDPRPFHFNHEAAKSTLFGGLAASDWHTAATTMRLLVGGGLPLAGGIADAGGEISWPKPSRPGVVLLAKTGMVGVTPSRSRLRAKGLWCAAKRATGIARCHSTPPTGWSCRAGLAKRGV